MPVAILTGNGTVVISDTDPDPIGGQVSTTDALPHQLMFGKPAVDFNNGGYLDGVMGFDMLIVAKSGVDVATFLVAVSASRVAAVTVVQNVTIYYESAMGALGGASVSAVANPDGTVGILVNAGAAVPTNWRGTGEVNVGPP